MSCQNVDKKSAIPVMYTRTPRDVFALQRSVAMTLGKGPKDFNRISKDKLL